MKNNAIRFALLTLALSLVLSGCGGVLLNPPTPTIDFAGTQTQNALRTEAAVTVVVAMTEAVAAELTSAAEPSPTVTLRPTATVMPTATQTITPSPEPTSTPTPVPTATLVVPTMTTKPVTYACNLISTDPFYKKYLSPGEKFTTHWVILNSGTETWFYEYVRGQYRNGLAMHSSGDIFRLTDAVKPGELYDVYVDMQAPWDPGEYSAIWTLNVIKTKKAFCWYSVDIIVK